MSASELRILTFVCNWCSYGGADQAGGLKLPYPETIRLVRVMCSGRVDPQMVLKAFREGADGVMILGCHPGDCHYKEGNLQTLKRYTMLKKMLPQFGIQGERFRLDWISAAERDKFVDVVSDMVERVRELGPLKD